MSSCTWWTFLFLLSPWAFFLIKIIMFALILCVVQCWR
jgi:hypothetical protein